MYTSTLLLLTIRTSPINATCLPPKIFFFSVFGGITLLKAMFTQNLAGCGGWGGVGKQTNGIVGDVQIANIDLNHFLNTDLTKWLKRKNFSSFFFYRALLIRIAL